MLKIGLTGGIGSGKSTIATLFSRYNVPIIDADSIARQLVEPNQPALTPIRKAFGDAVFDPNGGLNREQLGGLIFTDSNKKRVLENILHPLIYRQMQAEFTSQTAAYSILSIPLLMETKRLAFVDRVLVVDCPLETQIERVRQRSLLSRKRILAIIAHQVSRQFRLAHADDVIDNSAAMDQLADKIKRLHNHYLLLGNA